MDSRLPSPSVMHEIEHLRRAEPERARGRVARLYANVRARLVAAHDPTCLPGRSC